MGSGLSVEQAPLYSRKVPNSARPGKHGPIHRSLSEHGPELSLPGGVTTTYEALQSAAALFPNNPCLGHRPIKDGQAQDFVWLSYAQVVERCSHLGSGLVHFNLLPPNPDGMRLLGIYSPNRPEWVIAEHAAFAHSATTVPMYDTLGVDTLAYTINQVHLHTLVCTGKELPVVLETTPSTPSLKAVVCMDELEDKAAWERRFDGVGVKLVGMKELEEVGRKNPVAHTPPAARDVASFCYTSGTTGNPKGALLTHQNLISDCAGGIRAGLQLSDTDVHLSYLPLPHMFERLIQAAVLHRGGAIGFFQNDTLKIVEDLIALRPTVFPSVPRLLNRMHDKLLQGVKDAGGVKEMLFNQALAAKIAGLRQGTQQHALWDRLVFNGVKAKVGLDRVRLIITGSAPIAPHVLDFLRAVFGCPVQEGYGQTESTAASTLTLPEDFTPGHVGGPLPNNEITLMDVPEMGYFSTDKVHGEGSAMPIKCEGRGEICFRGPNVFSGYYKMEEKTKEAIDEEGWLHSGDIGLWLPNGALKIIDRKKNIFKLAQGEYVAPEKIENVYNRSELVMQSFVHGDSLQATLVAVVVPDPEATPKWAQANGLGDKPFEEVVKSERFKAAIVKELQREGKRAKLQGFEMVRDVHIEPEPWTPQNGILTPTFKLKRQQACERYRKEIDVMYAKLAVGKAKL